MERIYFRDTTFQYPLRSHPGYGFYTAHSPEKQALLSRTEDCTSITALIFDPSGSLIDEVVQPIEEMKYVGNSHTLLGVTLERAVHVFRKNQGMTDNTIWIRRFDVPKHHMKLEDYPDEFQEFITNPDKFSAADQEELRESLAWWNEGKQYVLHFRNEYWVNMEGVVTSS